MHEKKKNHAGFVVERLTFLGVAHKRTKAFWVTQIPLISCLSTVCVFQLNTCTAEKCLRATHIFVECFLLRYLHWQFDLVLQRPPLLLK